MSSPTRTTFPIRFDRAYGALSRFLGMSPSDSFVEIDGPDVRIRMAWAFRTVFPRATVRSVVMHDRRPISRGVHGWNGEWLVNGSGDGIVRVALDPPQRAHVLGFPVRLRTLLVSVDDPVALQDALTGPRRT